ncbi:MAG TPA: DUF2911 domain-containing protein [Longimicrobium sp.]|jgi:hypothetical protein
MTRTFVRPLAAIALALAAGACGGGAAMETPAPAPAAAPQSESAAFVVTIGTDTVSVERYTRTATTLTGEVVTRTPRTTARSYRAQLRPDGSVSSVEVTTRVLNAPPSTPPTIATVTFGSDTASVRVARGDSVQNQRISAGANAFPQLGAYALYEQAIMHTRRAGMGEARLRFLAPGAPQPGNVGIRTLGADSLELTTGAGPATVRIDSAGRLLALSGLQSTQKFIVRRLPSLDVAALGASYAQREASGSGLGTLSPRDSVRATIGGANIVIDYGRPLKRGRRVLGEVVPLDQVWRTGANAATGLRTDRDLVIGGTRVPAGSYTLFSLPSRDGWKLIVSRQTGQWGTEYHPEQDLARIDLQRRAATPAVEQFTIRIDPSGAGAGTLRMLWDDFELAAPIEVR